MPQPRSLNAAPFPVAIPGATAHRGCVRSSSLAKLCSSHSQPKKPQPDPMMGGRCRAAPNILLCLTRCLPHHHLNWFQHHPRCWWGAKQTKRSQIASCQLEEVSFGVRQHARFERAPSVKSNARSSKYLFTTQESFGPWIYPRCCITLPITFTAIDRNFQVEQKNCLNRCQHIPE